MVSPGRRVRETRAMPIAVTPATMPCIIGPSRSRTAGDAQRRTTRRRRAFDTSVLIAMAADELARRRLWAQAGSSAGSVAGVGAPIPVGRLMGDAACRVGGTEATDAGGGHNITTDTAAEIADLEAGHGRCSH